LDYLFNVQQKPDGSFPQNSKVDGTPVFGSLQLDEVADPIILAYQLGRKDATTWSQHVKPAANFLVNFVSSEGYPAPYTPQERWEEQNGYSPSSIASEIAGLVCAANIAQANGDSASAQLYLATADSWQSQLEKWTVTQNGPYRPLPYYVRLTKDGNANAGTTTAWATAVLAASTNVRWQTPVSSSWYALGSSPPTTQKSSTASRWSMRRSA
jgi:glucoamylase